MAHCSYYCIPGVGEECGRLGILSEIQAGGGLVQKNHFLCLAHHVSASHVDIGSHGGSRFVAVEIFRISPVNPIVMGTIALNESTESHKNSKPFLVLA